MNPIVPEIPRPKPRTRLFGDQVAVTLFFGAGAFLGLLVLAVALPRSLPAVLWALGMLAAGGLVGFLFGHPRAGRSGTPTAPTPSVEVPSQVAPATQAAAPATPVLGVELRTRPSTALEDIVDWLTKMVVGIGLVQLKDLPSAVLRLGTLVSRSLAQPSCTHWLGCDAYFAQSIAVGIVVFFTSIGFLYGYLATRLYIQGAINRADGALREDVDRMIQNVAQTQQKQVVQEVALQKISKVAAASAVQTKLGGEGDSVVITDAASTDVELWNTDPNKGQFGGASSRNGRFLQANLKPAFPGQPNMEACWVEITVKSTDPARPLTGTVVFYLHPTYAPPTCDVPVVNGEATLKLQAWGAFTLGAVADAGSTRLELDLMTVAGGSPAFYET